MAGAQRTREETMITEEQKTAPEFVEVEAEDLVQEESKPETLTALEHDSTKDGIRLIAAYHFVWSAILVLGMLAVSIPTVITAIVGITDDPEVFIATAILGFVVFVLMLLATIYGIVGYGLWKRRQWARTSAIAVGILSLPAIPLGTLGGGVTLWYLLQERVARTFS